MRCLLPKGRSGLRDGLGVAEAAAKVTLSANFYRQPFEYPFFSTQPILGLLVFFSLSLNRPNAETPIHAGK
jgi:hypothetical protein